MARTRGRKRTNDLYFGPEQEEAVAKYLSIGVTLELTGSTGKPYYIWSGTTSQQTERDKIYMQHLYEPLNKMVESIIRKYKLYRKDYTFEDIHADALSFLMMKSYKFDVDAGKRAYSYYGTIIKNYLLGSVQKDDKSLKKFASYEDNYEQIDNRYDLSYNIEIEDEGLVQLIIISGLKQD
jgi:DNA-directed RNA polymerase specialized sigma subunit